MGRGSSKAGGAGGGKIVTTAIAENGESIDLTNTPLQYGQNDAALTGKAREAVEAQEKKRLKAKIEYGAVYDAEGNIIGMERKGARGSVRVPMSDYMKATTMTHNHPRGTNEPVLGGTFSDQDLKVFAYYDNLKTMRASASEGTYSITKGANFNDKRFVSFVNNMASTRHKEYSATEKAKRKDYRAGKISYNEYVKGANDAFNSFVVNLHNDLLAGQKEYGYNYTLEQR